MLELPLRTSAVFQCILTAVYRISNVMQQWLTTAYRQEPAVTSDPSWKCLVAAIHHAEVFGHNTHTKLFPFPYIFFLYFFFLIYFFLYLFSHQWATTCPNAFIILSFINIPFFSGSLLLYFFRCSLFLFGQILR